MFFVKENKHINIFYFHMYNNVTITFKLKFKFKTFQYVVKELLEV